MRLKIILLCILCVTSTAVSAQKKKKNTLEKSNAIVDYTITEKGDTINRLDTKKRKQGLWMHTHDALRGEPSYTEIGNYIDDVKTGMWKFYSNEGLVMKEENYKRGALDGETRIYEDGFLSVVGNYKALTSKYAFDTFYVETPTSDKLIRKILPASLGSVRHGFWTYYDPQQMRIVRVQEYQADEIIYEKEYSTQQIDSTYIKSKEKLYPHNASNAKQKPTFWILDKKKKPVKYSDMPENGQNVKPNVKKR